MRSFSNFFQILGSVLFSFLTLASYSQTPEPPPAMYNSGMLVNYIRTWDAMAPETNANTLMTRQLKDVKQATQYFDGLGRPLQTVIKQGSLATGGTAVDMISPVVYDEFGREKYNYLPFASTATDITKDNGLFKLDPFQQQATFMTSQYGAQGETFFYSKNNFEASPLSRVEKSMAPGNSWVGNNKGVEAKYFINTATDDVKKWNVTDVQNNLGTYSINGSYPAGELYKNVTADEHGKQIIEFKDKEGKVILKKVQLTATADAGTGRDYTGWLCTYYIYDDLNNLRCVIQPEGVKYLFTNNWPAVSTTILNEQCFRYEYDARDRMIKKKVPGAGEVWMVYDTRDRLVMTQDANLRPLGKWLYTEYDDLNRPRATGITYESHDQAYNANLAKTTSPYPDLAAWGYELYTHTIYDDYSWLPNYPVPGSFTSNRITSYDNYLLSPSNTSPYPQQVTQSNAIKGMVTGSRVLIPGNGYTFYTVNYYDDKGRLIQTQSNNITGGIDITITQYNWAGQPLLVIQKNEIIGSNAQTTVVVTQMTYDDLGRISKVEKKLSNTLVNGGTMSAYKTIVQHEYDKLGQLKNKKLAPAYNNNAGLETLNYDYNIRGWMLGANRDYAKDASNNNYFGFDLGYDKTNNNIIGNQTYANPQFNGNIEGIVWKSKGDGEKRKYDFTYDAANRLLKANFNQYTSSSFTKTAGVDFSMQMGDGLTASTAYDENGNIKAMKQWGLKITGSSVIDDMTYNYYTGSNKLLNVIDAQSDPQTKLGDFRYSSLYATALGGPKSNAATDYTYDDNGNLKKDRNKDIGDGSNDGIVYNYLNLPQTITVRTTSGAIKGTITYTYDAAGNKLKKEVTETGQPLKTTLYLGGAIYENDILQFIGHEEGRIRFKPANGSIPASFQFDYMLKDHLGNVRMLLTEEQQQDIYPASTLEGSQVATDKSMLNYEKKFYTIDNNFITDKTAIPSWTAGLNYENNNGNPPPNNSYPTDHTVNSTAISDKLYKLNATANKTGLGLVIKVMAGDKVDIHGKSYYNSTQTFTNSNSTQLILTDIINAFLGTPNNAGTAKGVTSSQMEGWNTGAIPGDFIRGSNGETTTIPKAYINFLFFDEQFKYAGAGGASRVGASGAVKSHWFVDGVLQNITAPKNGYLYVYVSNESNVDVFFDNLQVMHTRGPILEETHYYPFGLTMAGISSKALAFGDPENKLKYNGIEKENDFQIEIYDAQLRELDGQTGRWWEIDPKVENMEGWSPYASNYDNPILYSDPLGDEGEACCKWFNDAVDWLNKKADQSGITDAVVWVNNNLNPLTPLAEGITGKSLNSNFTEDKSRSESAVQLGTFLIPTAKAEAIIANEIKNVIVNQVEKQVVKNLEKKVITATEKKVVTKTATAGQTASGQAIDKFGNKLGPSGKPQINVVKHSTQKRAKDAARNEGKGAAIKHTSPKKGQNHYHPVDQSGNKKPNSTHHEY